MYRRQQRRIDVLQMLKRRCVSTENKQKQKLQVLTIPGYILCFLTSLYFYISIQMFCTLFICLVFDGLLQSICFRMFLKLNSQHSITFENTYFLSCQFHRVDIFYIEFRFSGTFVVTNSVTKILLIETRSNFRTIKV